MQPEPTIDEATASASRSLAKARLDEHLLEFLAAYEEYITCHVELEGALRQGHIGLAQSRRDLAAKSPGRPTVSAVQFPTRFEARLRLDVQPSAGGSGPPELRAVLHEPDERFNADGQASSSCSSDAEEEDVLAALDRMGVGAGLKQQIAAAVRDDGEDVATACGDQLAVEHRHGDASRAGAGAVYAVRSAQVAAAGDLGALKRAQFAGAMADAAGTDPSPKPKLQARPSSSRDPLRWFAVLPPASLRRTQQGFRRAAESAAACANAQARMDAAGALYEALYEEVYGGPPAEALAGAAS